VAGFCEAGNKIRGISVAAEELHIYFLKKDSDPCS